MGFSVRGRVASELRLEIILYGSREIFDSPTLNSLGLKTIYSTGRVVNATTEHDLRSLCYFICWRNFEFVFKLNMLLLGVKSIV